MDHKRKAFAVSQHNRYSAIADLNRDTKVTGQGSCDNDNSSEPGIMVLEEELTLERRKCESGITHQSHKKSKASKKISQLLVGDSIVRDVNLGKDTEVLKEVRCVPGATASRDKKYILKIVKNASKDYDLDAIIHLGTNDLSQKDVLSVQKDFQSLEYELSNMGCRLIFSEVLPVYKEQKGKGQRVAEFNVWLKECVKGKAFVLLVMMSAAGPMKNCTKEMVCIHQRKGLSYLALNSQISWINI
uniref:SGNH hydrolase-type esterase domain-containing protein n=1 Tax=Micrurus lemniscatus lemniscatus TaxID=129467 RepID=A0A2D4J0N8_MICLE